MLLTRPVSIALEIVGADWLAQVRPPARAPVIDESSIAHECLESLGLPHAGGCWPPGKPERSVIALFHRLLIPIEHPFRPARICVDEIQFRVDIRQLGRRIRLVRRCAKNPRSGFDEWPSESARVS